MGLCKCPQRKVTNIFCYEHRVNVCEHCLMHNHPKCVVDTYRNWITDSVYSPKCELCEQDLSNGETVRLLCLHIVHWDCLDGWARSLPPTTAAAGYTCPICRKMGIFPAANQVSPIADELKRKMSQVNWARIGLGLSPLDNDPPLKSAFSGNWNGNTRMEDRDDGRSDASSEVGFSGINNQSHAHGTNEYNGVGGTQAFNQSYLKLSDSFGQPPQPYVPVIDPTVTTTRKTVKFDPETPLLIEEDDNKYRRKTSSFESLSRWLRQMNPANRRRSRRRTILYVIGSIIGILIFLMFIFGRGITTEYDQDEAFNLHANPNILIGEGKAPVGHEFDS